MTIGECQPSAWPIRKKRAPTWKNACIDEPVNVLLLLPLILSVACGTPSRRLPTRVVDDPVTLPRRMLLIGVGWEGTPADENRKRQSYERPSVIEYGITDQATMRFPLVAVVALLDDSPQGEDAEGDQDKNDPFTLAVWGGLGGIGYSSSEVFIIKPTLGAGVSRRFGRQLRLGAQSTWYGSHSRLGDYSTIGNRVMLTAQIWQRVALVGSVFDVLSTRSLAPSTRWSRHALGANSGLAYRPWHWLTLSGTVAVVAVWRPRTLQSPLDPFGPLPPEPPSGRLVLWGGVWAATHW